MMKYISEEKLNKFLDENFSSCYSCGEIGGYDDLKEEISELYEEIDAHEMNNIQSVARADK